MIGAYLLGSGFGALAPGVLADRFGRRPVLMGAIAIYIAFSLACALVTDGRFSGGTSGLSIGHCSPEAAAGGSIALVQEGDRIDIDIPGRSIRLAVSDDELTRRREAMNAQGPAGWKPTGRNRNVSPALRAYAALTTSADRGAVRDVTQVEGITVRR